MARDESGAAARAVPSLDRLLRDAALAALIERHGRTRVTRALRVHLEDLRGHLKAGALDPARLADAVAPATIAASLARFIASEDARGLRRVHNLTGVVLHTNLGRAVLPRAAIDAAVRAMGAPVDLEYDLDGGRRGERDAHVQALVRELTGAEAATVVNNNAAAVLLALDTLARRREVIVSRGELVEIGGAFRVPDVMRSAGARLVEVGTTNRTHARDYAEAIRARTALLMQVHASNYAISGFTARVDTAGLAAIARAHGLPLVVDLGSGSLVDLAEHGLPREPTVQETLAAGADLILFSGDKLLGGPQAGLIAGRADLIAKINRNPLKRALRMDKTGLAALAAVLALYREPENLARTLPTLRALVRSAADIAAQAGRLREPVARALGAGWQVEVATMDGQVGSGAQPTAALVGAGLRIEPAARVRGGLDRLARRLRALPRPVLGRLADDALWLDLRGLDVDDEADFVAQLGELAP